MRAHVWRRMSVHFQFALLCASWCPRLHAARIMQLETADSSALWGPPSCEDTEGAVAREDAPYPSCKCDSESHKVFCAGVEKGPRNFDAEEILAEPSCLRPVCAKRPSCGMISGAAPVQFPWCVCKVESHGVYCGLERVAERLFNATALLPRSLCANPVCAREPTCGTIEGAEGRSSEPFPLCKCSTGLNSVQCGDRMVAGQQFNASTIWADPDCSRPRCVRAGRDCNVHVPQDVYVPQMKQATGSDSFLAQMASISDRINSLDTPVSGWDLVKSWNTGDQRGCAYVENVGVYQRDGHCALAFSSTARLSDMPTNMNVKTRTWCGLQGMQAGYARRLDDFVHGHRFNEFKDMLGDPGQCRSVVGVGHSMGGALISMMAACANQKGYFNVDSLYTFGAPAVSTEQLSNDRTEDGCFAGYRIYIMDKNFMDPVPSVFSPLDFKHPKLREYRLVEQDGNVTVLEHGCLENHTKDSPTFFASFPSIDLHRALAYVKRLLKIGGPEREEQVERSWHNFSMVQKLAAMLAWGL